MTESALALVQEETEERIREELENTSPLRIVSAFEMNASDQRRLLEELPQANGDQDTW